MLGKFSFTSFMSHVTLTMCRAKLGKYFLVLHPRVGKTIVKFPEPSNEPSSCSFLCFDCVFERF